MRRDPNSKEIHQSIEAMDRDGISLIEKKDGVGFHSYPEFEKLFFKNLLK